MDILFITIQEGLLIVDLPVYLGGMSFILTFWFFSLAVNLILRILKSIPFL